MGAAIAAVIARRERDVVQLFRRASATSPSTARSLSALDLDDALAVKRLRNRAVLRETDNGDYYLDEQSWTALRRTRRRLMVTMILAIVTVLLGTLVATGTLGR
jgi:hypothetical protein